MSTAIRCRPGAHARMGSTRFRLPDAGFRAMAFSPDGKTIASLTSNGQIHLWDAATGGLQYAAELWRQLANNDAA
jgi:WD40 repeat protein